MTIHEADELGLQIRHVHYRYPESGPATLFPAGYLKELGIKAAAKGGATVARVYTPSGMLVAEGVAKASPLDNFSRKRGRDIAVGRALKDL